VIRAFKNISSLVLVSNDNSLFKIKEKMRDVCEIKDGAVIFDEKILWVGKSDELDRYIEQSKLKVEVIVSMQGHTIMPGFIDPHTHLIFGGDRSAEFARRLEGATYVQIAEEGGGIQSTVRATRAASLESLVENGRKLMLNAIKHGTVGFEIKSGYGLSVESEIKSLQAIKQLKDEFPVHISSTFLGAHDFPPEFQDKRDEYVDIICNEMLPSVAKDGLADYCDAFVDKGYYTVEQGEKIFRKAKELGMKIKMHADELACVGAAELAGKVGAISADHLLFVSDEGIEALKSAGTVATLLPGTSFFIRMPHANARKIIDSGAITALSTDCNPGSSFTENMQMILWLAVINLKMTAEEALTAATLNAAHAIEQSDKLGSLEPGKDASFIILDCPSYKELFYHFGMNHVQRVFINGKEFIQ
jgi:imidazolonepropionase